MRKKITLKKRLHKTRLAIIYSFDKWMAKGIVANIGFIFIISLVIILILSVLSMLITSILKLDSESERTIWTILIHIIDGGTVGNNRSTNMIYLSFMLVVTVLGLLINGALIGSINAAIGKKLSALGLSNTKVYEHDHTVIIGFNSRVNTIINELLSNYNDNKHHCIVILSDMDLKTMYEKIKDRFPNTGKVEIICRTGDPNDDRFLRLCSISRAKSVIINTDNDYETINLILATSKYFEKSGQDNPELHIVATINEEENLIPAKLAGGNIVNLVNFNDSMARIIAHSCRSPGVSKVLSELFSFKGNEIYFEEFPKLAGKTFSEILYLFNNSSVIGIKKREGDILINPAYNTIYNSGDLVIHIAESANYSKPVLQQEIPKCKKNVIWEPIKSASETSKVLILGKNRLLKNIISELDKYVSNESSITILSKYESTTLSDYTDLKNINDIREEKVDSFNYETLKTILTDYYDTIVLLCDISENEKSADAQIITNLICIHNIMIQNQLDYNIIIQLRSSVSQKIADTGFSDFIVGSELTSTILTQISENKSMVYVFNQLLSTQGSELFIRPMREFITDDIEISFHQLQKIAEKRHQIIIGYKKAIPNSKEFQIFINPERCHGIKFSTKDSLIVLADEIN